MPEAAPAGGGKPEPTLNEFQQQLVRNAMVTNFLMSRANLLTQALDPRRDVYKECGYPTTTDVSVQQYRDLFDRQDIANRVVEVLPKETWACNVDVYEDEDDECTTPFEAALKDLGKQLLGDGWYEGEDDENPLWEYLCRLDIMSGIGHFGVLLIGIDDGLPLDTPAEGIDECGKMVDVAAKPGRHDQPRYDSVAGAVRPSAAKEALGVETSEDEGDDEQGYDEEGDGSFGEGVYDDEEASADPDGGANPSALDHPPGGEPDEPVDDRPPVHPPGDPHHADGTGAEQQHRRHGLHAGTPEKGTDDCRKVLYLRVFDESLVQVTRWEDDPRNPRYGQPVLYQITLNDPKEHSTGVGLSMNTVDVHWTRVIHVADNRLSSEVMGVPRMRPVLNRLLDLQKLHGGSAEMYWKGALPGYSLETHPELGGEADLDLSNVRDQLEQYEGSLTRWLGIPGLSIKSLAPQVVDPTSQIDAQVSAICIQIGCPRRIFEGSERGELASSQDSSAWNDRIRGRQRRHVTPRIIVPTVNRLIMLRVLPVPECYTVEWEELDALSAVEKAQVATAEMGVISTFASSGAESVMSTMDMYTEVLGKSKARACELVENACQAQADPMTGGAQPAGGQPVFDEDGQEVDPLTGEPVQPGPPGQAGGPPQGGAAGGPPQAPGGPPRPPGKGKPPAFGGKPKGPPKPPPVANAAGVVITLNADSFRVLAAAAAGDPDLDVSSVSSFRDNLLGVTYAKEAG